MKIMILGAGPNQVRLIQRARELGLHVITVDYLPDNVGHKLSHRYVNCSTMDKEGVLRAAETLGIDGIVTCASDAAVPAVGYVAERLGLPGPTFRAATTMVRKDEFRAFQHANGLAAPRFAALTEPLALEDAIRGWTPPVMVKPADTSGSRGVSRVDVLDARHLTPAFEAARRHAHTGEVLVESYVEGEDVSGDGFIRDGRAEVVVTKKHKAGFIPIGHELPTTLSREEHRSVVAALENAAAALGYEDGPIDFDARVSGSRALILEMSPRLGGNAIPEIIERACGVSLYDLALNLALGRPAALPAPFKVGRRCASWIFGSRCKGRVEAIASSSDVIDRVPLVFACHLHVKPGDQVEAFEHSGNALGQVLFDLDEAATFDAVVEALTRAIGLAVSPGGARNAYRRAGSDE